MLKIQVLRTENFDDAKQEFVTEYDELLLEHSLVSLSKWESKWEKPFLGLSEKTDEEAVDYVRAMILTPDFPPDVLSRLSSENVEEINAHIQSKMTATWFNELPNQPGKNSSEVITNELIYYWLTELGIPHEYETWHLNRLFTLIKVVGAKRQKPKKVNRADAIAQRKALNDQRKLETGSTG